MGACNGCGDCCDPVVIPMDRFAYILMWAERPPMEGAALERYRELGYKVDEPGVIEQGEIHRANGIFARDHWEANAHYYLGDPAGEVVKIDCPFFDKEARSCGAYDQRPLICQGFPWYDQDPVEFIRKNPRHMSTNCSYWEDVPVTMRPRGWTLRRQWKT